MSSPDWWTLLQKSVRTTGHPFQGSLGVAPACLSSNSWPYFLLDFYHCPENQASGRSLEEREESDLQPSL